MRVTSAIFFVPTLGLCLSGCVLNTVGDIQTTCMSEIRPQGEYIYKYTGEFLRQRGGSEAELAALNACTKSRIDAANAGRTVAAPISALSVSADPLSGTAPSSATPTNNTWRSSTTATTTTLAPGAAVQSSAQAPVRGQNCQFTMAGGTGYVCNQN